MYKLNDMVDHEKIEEGCCYILQGSDDIIVLKDLEELVLNMLINDGIENTIKKLSERAFTDIMVNVRLFFTAICATELKNSL